MTLIKSISGIRGTIGGPAGENLTPPDVVKFTTAYVRLIARRNPGKKLTIVGPCWPAARTSSTSGCAPPLGPRWP